jgi:hypothetical protein
VVLNSSYRLKPNAKGGILFVQPFSLGSPGGGPRILRALLRDSAIPWTVVCTSPEPPQILESTREIHLPIRPYFGRIERSRLAFLPMVTTPLFQQSFVRHFERLCRQRAPIAIHSIPHSWLDFHHAHRVAARLGLPFCLQVHDDFAYSSLGHVPPKSAHRAMQSAWCGADVRFVISSRLGDEYCRRYGARDFTIITDGLERVASAPTAHAPGELRIYFMGLFHLAYEENLRVLCAAMERLRVLRPSMQVSITLRCGGIRSRVMRVAPDLIRVLPFGTEADVHCDLDRADLAYLPLAFGMASEPLVRYSLSTKLVTYLGSGVPILYHGPKTSAAYELLVEHSAAFFDSSLQVESLVETLRQVCDERSMVAQICGNALNLARNRFMLQDQRTRFWNAVMRVVTGNVTTTSAGQPIAKAT